MRNDSGIHPTGDMVLVKPLKVEQTSAGGIVIAQSTLDKEQLAQTYGVLVEFGQDAPKEPRMHGVKPGMVVYFARYAGIIEDGDDGEKYRVMRADDVVGYRDRAPDTRPYARRPMPKSVDSVTTPE